MLNEIEIVKPMDIEKRSMAIITEELGGRTWPEPEFSIVKRCIHTSADFDYADNLCFSEHAAAALQKPLIIAVGNAPTALIRLYELIQEGKIRPELIIGAPVGFVNVVEAKELIMTAGIPYIVPRGRKGGSNIAATICNAMLYQGGR